MKDRWVVPNFLPPDILVELEHQASTKPWGDYLEPETGAVYKRIQLVNEPLIYDLISEEMGRPINAVGAALRLNYEGENPNQAIHSDGDGYGNYVLVLPLTQNPPAGSGTAFWEHYETRVDRIKSTDYETIRRVHADFNSPDQFVQLEVVESKYNQALFYRSELLHSRWPFEAYGSTPEDGRLALVVFFT